MLKNSFYTPKIFAYPPYCISPCHGPPSNRILCTTSLARSSSSLFLQRSRISFQYRTPTNPPSIQFHFHQIPSSYAFPLPFRQTTHDDRGLNSSIRPFPFTAAAALPPPPLQHKFNCEASVFRSSPRRPSAAQQQQRQMPRKETSPPPPYRIILRTIAYGRRSGASNLFLRNILLWRVFAFAFLFPDSAVS